MKDKRKKAIGRKNYLEKVSLPLAKNFRNVFSVMGLAVTVDAFQSLFTGESFIYGKPANQVINYLPYACISFIPLGCAKISELSIEDYKNEIKALGFGIDNNRFDYLGVKIASNSPTNFKESFYSFFK